MTAADALKLMTEAHALEQTALLMKTPLAIIEMRARSGRHCVHFMGGTITGKDVAGFIALGYGVRDTPQGIMVTWCGELAGQGDVPPHEKG